MKLLSIFRPVRNKFLTGRALAGFTLIEVLVVMAMFSVLVGLGLFMSMDMFRGYSARSERDVVVSALGKARSRAMANLNQSPWGVCVLEGGYVIFQGTVCAAAAGGESIPVSKAAAVSGLSPGIIFTQLSGTTTPATVAITENARTSTVTINYEGTIIW